MFCHKATVLNMKVFRSPFLISGDFSFQQLLRACAERSVSVDGTDN